MRFTEKSMRARKSVLPLLFLATAGSASISKAQSTGSFTATANLSTPRQFHTATLLTNGKVLIAGGFAVISGWPVWASAEVYEPSIRTFTATGDMTTARYFHTATLLVDGKVLIAGGSSIVNGRGSLGTAELYDPATGSFARTGEMTMPRRGHTATLLPDGKVLIAGGVSSDASGSLASAELYDPLTGNFTATGEMTTGRSWLRFTATLLTNGKVLIAGESEDVPSADLFDPDTGAFTLTGHTSYPYLAPGAAILLTNGKVLLTLLDSENTARNAELYDSATGSFTGTGNMTIGRGYSTATLLPDGKVLIAGRDPVHFGGSGEIYDSVTGTFSAFGDMLTQSAEGHTATLLADGTILLTGGWICCGSTIKSAEIYHPPVAGPSPVLLSVPDDRQPAILHASTHQLVSSSNPAQPGEALEIYLTGLTDGSVIPPQVSIGGRMARVLFFGRAPGFATLNQVNALVPSGIAPGPAVPVRLTYLSRPSNQVTIAVR
jgi:WD40 repeat protein